MESEPFLRPNRKGYFKLLHLNPFIMKKKLLNLAFGVSLSVGCLTQMNAQDAQIKFFGQPEFIYKNRSEKLSPTDWDPFTGVPNETVRDTSNTNFNTGKMVLFVTAQLNDRISVLSENSMSTGNGKFDFEIERLLLRYYLKDYFSVRVGKMFTPMGYWNNQYNLGLVLQPTIQRPLVIRNSSDGGVLQIKDVGFQFEGDEITKLRFFYRGLVSNGIGFTGANDKGVNSVALTGQMGIEPIDGLRLLVSASTAELYKGTVNVNGITPQNGRQSILNASVAFMSPEKKVEFIGEYYHSKSTLDSIGDNFSQGFFTYAGYKVTNKIVPYAMYSYSQAGTKTQADLYYIPAKGVLANQVDLVLGVRYKINSNFVLKLEYENSTVNYTYKNGSFAAMPVFGPFSLYDGDKKGFLKTNSVRMQFAFAF